mmetsp:Transcript_44054/g.114578  ORF Transcript_44054/g.114578 Transcript_44054/m.114578 type:complete len:417 (-) Transcript_44054:102-1352(-)
MIKHRCRKLLGFVRVFFLKLPSDAPRWPLPRNARTRPSDAKCFLWAGRRGSRSGDGDECCALHLGRAGLLGDEGHLRVRRAAVLVPHALARLAPFLADGLLHRVRVQPPQRVLHGLAGARRWRPHVAPGLRGLLQRVHGLLDGHGGLRGDLMEVALLLRELVQEGPQPVRLGLLGPRRAGQPLGLQGPLVALRLRLPGGLRLGLLGLDGLVELGLLSLHQGLDLVHRLEILELALLGHQLSLQVLKRVRGGLPSRLGADLHGHLAAALLGEQLTGLLVRLLARGDLVELALLGVQPSLNLLHPELLRLRRQGRLGGPLLGQLQLPLGLCGAGRPLARSSGVLELLLRGVHLGLQSGGRLSGLCWGRRASLHEVRGVCLYRGPALRQVLGLAAPRPRPRRAGSKRGGGLGGAAEEQN